MNESTKKLLDEIRKGVNELNGQASMAGDILKDVEQELDEMNLGIGVFVDIETAGTKIRTGYLQLNGKYRLCVTSGDGLCDLSKAKRNYRIIAANNIDLLLEAIKEELKGT